MSRGSTMPPTRRAVTLCLVAAAGMVPACNARASDSGEALEALRSALATGERTAEQVLTDPALMDLHPDTRFRELMRKHSAEGPLALVSPEEKGQPMILAGTIRDTEGTPVAGALLYVFHADVTGSYTVEKPMDEPHARIFGYLRSDSDGRYEVRTIRPGGYPASVQVDGEERRIPEHIHVVLSAAGFLERRIQIYFADDPRTGPEWVARSAERHGFPIVAVEHGADGIQRSVGDLSLIRD